MAATTLTPGTIVNVAEDTRMGGGLGRLFGATYEGRQLDGRHFVSVAVEGGGRLAFGHIERRRISVAA